MTLADRLREIAAHLPDDCAVTFTGAAIRLWLDGEPAPPAPIAPAIDPPATWRERLWTCPEATLLGVRELAEAVDRSADWVYRAVNVKRSDERGRHPLPCSKLDGVLTFEAGAVRRWLKSSSATVNAEPTPRALRKVQ